MNRDQKIFGVGKTVDYRKKIIFSLAKILYDHFKYWDRGNDKPLTLSYSHCVTTMAAVLSILRFQLILKGVSEQSVNIVLRL